MDTKRTLEGTLTFLYGISEITSQRIKACLGIVSKAIPNQIPPFNFRVLLPNVCPIKQLYHLFILLSLNCMHSMPKPKEKKKESIFLSNNAVSGGATWAPFPARLSIIKPLLFSK